MIRFDLSSAGQHFASSGSVGCKCCPAHLQRTGIIQAQFWEGFLTQQIQQNTIPKRKSLSTRMFFLESLHFEAHSNWSICFVFFSLFFVFLLCVAFCECDRFLSISLQNEKEEILARIESETSNQAGIYNLRHSDNLVHRNIIYLTKKSSSCFKPILPQNSCETYWNQMQMSQLKINLCEFPCALKWGENNSHFEPILNTPKPKNFMKVIRRISGELTRIKPMWNSALVVL